MERQSREEKAEKRTKWKPNWKGPRVEMKININRKGDTSRAPQPAMAAELSMEKW